MSTWIKRSEREPTQADGRKIGGYWDSERDWVEFIFAPETPLPERCTHWRSIKADPPPRELTQREKDEEMGRKIARSYLYSEEGRIAREAIYTERREVAKLLTAIYGQADWGACGGAYFKETQRLRARLDEQGAGK